MKLKKHSPIAAYLFRAAALAALCSACSTLKCEEHTPAQKPDAAELVAKGRQLFAQTRYVEALKAFEGALDQNPKNKETRFLAALAAFWARKPERALAYWNHLLDLVDRSARGGNDEWEIQKNRVITLAALGQFDVAEMVADRLREIRAGGKSSAAKLAKGYVREHFFGKRMRAGCWESFDERGDSPTLWSLTVKLEADLPAPIATPRPDPTRPQPSQNPPEEKTIATLAVETAALPGGGTGYIFSEETAELRRVYKRWTERPRYSEVRALIVATLAGTAQPIEEKPINRAPAALVLDDDEQVPFEIRNMGLDAQTETIVFTAWKLKRVKADVTQLARLTPGDDVALENYMRDFNAKYPHAAATASELSELVSTAKADCVARACEKLVKLKDRSAYLEFAVLTALNTRDRDIPALPLAAFAKSSDFLVRETTGLLFARHGHKLGLEILFNEIEPADARGCELVMGALEELLGHVFDSPPNSNAPDVEQKLKDWKTSAAEWRKENLETLEYTKKPNAGEPNWAKK